MPVSDPFAQNIQGVQSLVGSKINKNLSGASNQDEGIQGEKIDEFELNMDDAELISLAKKWTLNYAGYESKVKIRQQENETYYLGKQKVGTMSAVEEGKGISANLLFEAAETFYPAALSQNPEPVVWSDNSPQGNEIADSVKTMLQYHADVLALRPKLTLMTRKWSLDFLGVIKHGWDNDIQEIKTEVRDVKDFIFDVNGYVDVYGDFVGYLGERITVTAEKLIEMFPKHKEYITVMVDGKMGTEVTYTEWWQDEYVFYTFKDQVLDKHKNPHFNYDRTDVGMDGEDIDSPGHNHFARPRKPYTFLSVFSIGRQPHDITGLIEQNIPNQRLISRRTEQIDFNLSRANNSVAFSENNFTQETAKQASQAWVKGHALLVPPGSPIKDAIQEFPAPAIPGQFFTDLENNMNNLRTIFGVIGITATDTDKDTTARGMILNQQYDNSRIGGGIGDRLEMVAKNVFNWWTQMYYVYYDEEHFASVMGQLKATEYITLSSQNLTARLVISVAPDSMKPHDEITEMNQAMSLWESGALDPQTLLTRLNFPNPKETAGQFMLYKLNPQLYFQMNFPDIAAQAQQMMPPPLAPAPAVPNGQGAVSGQAAPSGGVPATAALSSVPLPK